MLGGGRCPFELGPPKNSRGVRSGEFFFWPDREFRPDTRLARQCQQRVTGRLASGSWARATEGEVQ